MAKKEDYIYYKGVSYPLAEYTTMAMKAAELRKSEGYIRKLVFRDKAGLKQPRVPISIEYLDIPELKLTLVKK